MPRLCKKIVFCLFYAYNELDPRSESLSRCCIVFCPPFCIDFDNVVSMSLIHAGVDASKTGAAAFITTSRKDESSGNGIGKTLRTGPRAGQGPPSNVSNPVKQLVKRPSKDKDRLNFFSSLRSKSSSTEARTGSEASSQRSQVSVLDVLDQIRIHTVSSSIFLKCCQSALQGQF